MAERLGEALLDLDTNDKGFRDGVDRAERRARGLGATFDDVGRRAAALGKAMGVAAAVGAAAFTAGIVAAVKRLETMRQASGRVDQALRNSGNTARTSAAEIEAWADILENRTGRAAEEVMDVAANLASYGFGREQFYRAIELANDMSAAWGGDLRQNLEGLSRALDDPINGMAMLSKRGIKLTDEQKALAAGFLASGESAKAQAVVFEALEAQVKGVAEAGYGGLTKKIAQAQKVWETAFEVLVTGKGDTQGLNVAIEQMIDTLSSKEFVDAAMGFGTLIVATINGIAQAVVFAHARLKEFFAWLDGRNPTNMGSDTLAARIAEQQAAIQAAEDKLYRSGFFDDKGGWFGSSMGAADSIANMRAELAKLQAELARRADPSQFDVGATFGALGDAGTADSPDALWRQMSPGTLAVGTGFGAGLAPAASKEASAVEKLILSLKDEQALLGQLDPVQRRMIELRETLKGATGQQRTEVEGLIAGIEAEKTAYESAQQALQFFGDLGLSSIEGLMDGTKSLTDVVGNLTKALAQAVLQSMLLGQGPLSGLFGTASPTGGVGGILGSLFAGMFATGGLIPNGSWGIVGERGPEAVIGTPAGAQVLPNSALSDMMGGGGRGDTHVTVNGSGLSQSELTQAIADALERYDRYQLPGRVTAIQADPMARG
jgi:hypothetical protein